MKNIKFIVVLISLILVNNIYSQTAIGRRWAICVGINNYEHESIVDLSKAATDASGMKSALLTFGQFDSVLVLTDKSPKESKDYPSKENLSSKLNYLQQNIQPEDLVVFFFSGHGVTDSDNRGYLVMADSDPDNIGRTGMEVKGIVRPFNEIGFKNLILMIDACKENYINNDDLNKIGLKPEEFNDDEIMASFYATESGGYSYPGIFSGHLIYGLDGDADNKKYFGNNDGKVSLEELIDYFKESIIDYTGYYLSKVQVPFIQKSILNSDFNISSYSKISRRKTRGRNRIIGVDIKDKLINYKVANKNTHSNIDELETYWVNIGILSYGIKKVKFLSYSNMKATFIVNGIKKEYLPGDSLLLGKSIQKELIKSTKRPTGRIKYGIEEFYGRIKVTANRYVLVRGIHPCSVHRFKPNRNYKKDTRSGCVTIFPIR